MELFDWIVLIGTLGFIVIYGTIKTRKNNSIEGYLRGGNEMKWTTIGLSVMATQASAITFISTPGQAFESGMGFVQNYFGLPLALIIVSAVFIPIYYKLKVYTAYEYLESRFGVNTRLLAAFLFLLQRGLAAGITIYAPAIILSSALQWNLNLTILLVGVLVVIYTVSGGTKAVSLTQKWQMTIIMGGMFIAFGIIIAKLPEGVSFGNALNIAGKMGKLEILNFSTDIDERYTVWTGLFGGLFLALSYFGTDQSQVQRYLGGQSIYESRMGMMFNAMLKVPMQFFILLTGVMVFVFYQFQSHPVLFDQSTVNKVYETEYKAELEGIENQYQMAFDSKMKKLEHAVETNDYNEIRGIDESTRKLRQQAKDIVIKSEVKGTSKDSDYVFLSFILKYMPHGLIGLLLAVIFSAAMSSTAGELNALASTTAIDFYKRIFNKEGSDKHYLFISKLFTALWGMVAIGFALFAHLVENLIEAVNILGSIFYGTILGIFLVAFFIKWVKGNAVFLAALLGQGIVIVLYILYSKEIAYLWYNVIGCAIVMMLSLLFNALKGSKTS